jgi:hypothetical protein
MNTILGYPYRNVCNYKKVKDASQNNWNEYTAFKRKDLL